MRTTNAILLLGAAMIAACSASDAVEPPPVQRDGAIVTVVFPDHPGDVFLVHVTDAATIAQAEAFVRTGTGPRLVTGRIVRGAGEDPAYPFHFIPESVRLTDAATELCDGAPMHTAEEVSQFFEYATGKRDSESAPWCPWESRPAAVKRLQAR